MKIHRSPHLLVGAAVAIGGFLLAGCEYDFPIAPKPTRAIDAKLMGDWVSVDGKDTMKVRQLDDTTYVVSYNHELYSAIHTDLESVPFVSVLHLDPTNRKYAFLTWALSDGDSRLRLRVVSSKVIAKDTRDSAALQAQLKRQAGNPDLFGFQQDYTRAK